MVRWSNRDAARANETTHGTTMDDNNVKVGLDAVHVGQNAKGMDDT